MIREVRELIDALRKIFAARQKGMMRNIIRQIRDVDTLESRLILPV